VSLLGPGRPICVTEGSVVVANERSSSETAQRWTLAVTAAAALMVALDALVAATALSTIRVHPKT
jgi:hypothetical protein